MNISKAIAAAAGTAVSDVAAVPAAVASVTASFLSQEASDKADAAAASNNACFIVGFSQGGSPTKLKHGFMRTVSGYNPQNTLSLHLGLKWRYSQRLITPNLRPVRRLQRPLWRIGRPSGGTSHALDRSIATRS